MRTHRYPLPLVVALASLLTVALTGAAWTGEGGGFNFTLDPILLQPMLVDVDSDSAKWEEYRDVDGDMTVPLIGLYGQSDDGNRFLDFHAENVSRDDARYSLLYGKSGSYRLAIDYNVIPHRFLNDGSLPWSTRAAPNNFQIADPVQSYLQASITERKAGGGAVNFDYLEGLTKPFFDVADRIDSRLDRRRTAIQLDIAKLSKFSLGVAVNHERRAGDRPYAGSFGFGNVLEIVEPIDYDTTNLELSGELRGGNAGLAFGYRFSAFENDNNFLMYDNPFRAVDSTSSSAYSSPGSNIDGPATGRNSLAPDNTANLLWVRGRGRLGDAGWINGNLSYNIMKQDEALAPFTTNTAINVASGAPFDATDPAHLPASSAGTEVKALNVQLGAGTKLGDRAKVKLGYRLYDYDNQSTVLEQEGYVRFDAVWEAIGRRTVPFSYRRQVMDASVGYDLRSGTNLSVGYKRDGWDRELREIDKSHDDILQVKLDHRVTGKLRFNARYEHGKRSIDEYLTAAQELSFVHPEGINNQPGLRKFDEAERTFDAGRIMAHIMAGDMVDLAVGFNARKDDYGDSEFGLLGDQSVGFNAEVNVNPSDKLALFAYGSIVERKVEQKARQSGAALSVSELDNWEADLDEVTNSWGAGLNAKLTPRLSLDVDGTWTDADGKADFFSPPGGTPDEGSGFANYDDSEWYVLKVKLGLDVNRNVKAGVGYWYEKFATSRFGTEGLSSYSPGAVLLNGNDGAYQANVFFCNLAVTF